MLIVSHDRRLLETVCDRLWVVGEGQATAFDDGYRAWRAAVADGWTVAAGVDAQARRLRAGRSASDGALRRKTAGGQPGGALRAARQGATGDGRPVAADTRPVTRLKARPTKLSKDAYRRQRTALDAELTRLGLRKNHLELAIGDPAVAANFVEMRRVTSELADVTAALAAAEDAWLELEERAP
jgi:ATPase subunit of ABC transporter with duplicated ATPase domains